MSKNKKRKAYESLPDLIWQAWKRTPNNHSEELEMSSAPDYPAWAFKKGKYCGVLIAIPKVSTEIDEEFANVYFRNTVWTINSQQQEVLELGSRVDDKAARPFATLCAEFINPGPLGQFRDEIIRNPGAWWQQWKELLGNKSVDEMVYDNLGELIVLRYLLKQGKNPKWNGPDHATYDIECGTEFFEVKSTIKREAKEITLNNGFQLTPPVGSKLFIVLCQFEPSESGESINSVVRDLANLNYDGDELNKKLAKQGLKEGKLARNRCYIIHSISLYTVDDQFPSITADSFKDGKFPPYVKTLSYTLSLEGVPFDKIL